MYAAGYGIKPWRAARAGGRRRLGRVVAALCAVGLAGGGLALSVHGDTRPVTTVVVQQGDTLWSIAADQYPADDVRTRVLDIEQANGLAGPRIEVGQTLKLPG